MKDLFTDLNPEQIEAVKHLVGPALVVAGPGSGKTRVLTHHAACLISQKVGPENILLVTFTNKAAGEMRSRVSQLLTANRSTLSASLPWSGTFHSVCSRILRKESSYLGLDPNFLIYDSNDSTSLIKKIIREQHFEEKKSNPAAVLAAISSAKNELLDPEEYQAFSYGPFYKMVAQIYHFYQKDLHKNKALDFDDLIFLTLKLFKENSKILNRYRDLFKYVLVDEYQDTNKAQYTLVKLLTQESQNIFVVGDMSQAIYSFRGADYRNILNFEKDFPEAKIYHLSQNYRSTQKIVEAAKNVIAKNRNHLSLGLWTENHPGGKIKIYEAKDEVDEANYIVNSILNSLNIQHSTLSKYAVLYRTNAQSRSIEEVFLNRGMPYVLVGGTRFYERKEIKDVLALLRLLTSVNDSPSLERIGKIGKRFSARYLGFLNSLPSCLELIQRSSSSQLINLTLKESGYLETFDKNLEEDLQRLENIQELRSVAVSFPGLGEFLENVQLIQKEYLVSDKGRLHKDSTNAVVLMTLHSAKGLEFPTVFMVGMEEGLFPHSRSLLETSELEEERRLCYVGITRAKENLHLSYARSRYYFGNRQSGAVSRFITEIPSHLTDFISSNQDYAYAY